MNLGLKEKDGSCRIIKIGKEHPRVWFHQIAEIHYSELKKVHFIQRGWEGILGYKHMLSVVGAALIIAWLFGKQDGWWKVKLLLPPRNS
jgi:cobalamin biosynthesis protein CobD/CbiB